MNDAPAPDAILLAAGKGSRMGADTPKVLFEAAGRPMIHWVIDACRQAGVQRIILVVGYKSQQVRDALAHAPDCHFVEQHELLGTGHAAQQAAPLFENAPPRPVFVLAGDGPLIRAATLHRLLQTHRQHNAAATLATAVLDEPTGYGRVLRQPDGSFQAIVEQKDATAEQLAVREVNPSYYCFQSDLLFDALSRIDNNNQQGEYYITDVPGLLQQQGHAVALVDAVPPEDTMGVNDPQQLAQIDQLLRQRLQDASESQAPEPRP